MSINFFNEDRSVKNLQKRKIIEWIKYVVKSEEFFIGDLAIIFCSDDYLLEINKLYLKHDYFTDIITFDYTVEQKISGDVFISIDRVKENTLKYNTLLNEELPRVIIHGVLHLLGYDDKTKLLKRKMREKEDEYLSILQIILRK